MISRLTQRRNGMKKALFIFCGALLLAGCEIHMYPQGDSEGAAQTRTVYVDHVEPRRPRESYYHRPPRHRREPAFERYNEMPFAGAYGGTRHRDRDPYDYHDRGRRGDEHERMRGRGHYERDRREVHIGGGGSGRCRDRYSC